MQALVRAASAACAPASLVHIVTTETTPGLDPQSFDAQPKSLFREGAKRSRLEEQPDDAAKVHALAVIDEPNIWMANLLDKTGRHIVDPGPTLETHASVFADDRIAPKILDLEFGCEAAYVAANMPKVDRVETIDGVPLDVHRLVDGTEAVEILQRPGVATPAFARYYRAGKLVWALRYDRYEIDPPSDPDMFTAPKGITYEEVTVKP
jgi:hypothetical protein